MDVVGLLGKVGAGRWLSNLPCSLLPAFLAGPAGPGSEAAGRFKHLALATRTFRTAASSFCVTDASYSKSSIGVSLKTKLRGAGLGTSPDSMSAHIESRYDCAFSKPHGG